MDLKHWQTGPDDGTTPLDEDESNGLIPSHIYMRSELNAWEAANIQQALDWVVTRPPDVLTADGLKALHRRMFDKTWSWAGTYRTSDKNISPFHWPEVPRLVADLLANVRAQCDHTPASPDALDALAARFHHALVQIHPWPNGNGRHARLATDVLLVRLARRPFSWGNATPTADDDTLRATYIASLREADAGEFGALLRFVRS